MRPLIVSIQLDGEEKCTNGGTGRVKESNKIFYIEKYSKSFLPNDHHCAGEQLADKAHANSLCTTKPGVRYGDIPERTEVLNLLRICRYKQQ